MIPTLFIRAPEHLEQDFEWVILDEGSSPPEVHRGPLNELAGMASGLEVVVLAPAGAITLAQTEIPTRNRSQLLKAVPYALEEDLAEPVEELHFAVHTRRNDKTLVAVVRRSWIDELLELLRASGIEPQVVSPELLCLPLHEGEWTLLLEDAGSLMRTGRQSGYAIDNPNLEPMLVAEWLSVLSAGPAVADAAAGQYPRIRIFDRRCTQEPLSAVIPAERILIDDSMDAASVLLARGYMAERPLNLLQGDHAVVSDWSTSWGRWKLVAGLALVALVIHLSTLWLENQGLSARSAELREAMTGLYKESFPDATRVINPVAQMRSRLDELKQQTGGGGGDFLALVVSAGRPVRADDKVGVLRLRYRGGQIDLDLEADSIERLESLQQRLRAEGHNAELKSVTNEGGRYQGRIILGGSA